MPTPEQKARQKIDALLQASGWSVQDRAALNLYAGHEVAVREYPLETGIADYLLFVDRRAAGIVEAKAEGVTLSAVADQAGSYAVGLPANIPHVELPLPFLYESTGVETYFRDDRDPQPRSRRVYSFHRPETLAEWVTQPETLRSRLRELPAKFPLIAANYYDQMVNKGKHHQQAICACATHLLDRILIVLSQDRPYQLRDVDDAPVSKQQARQIIAQRYHVPTEVRQRNNKRRRREQVERHTEKKHNEGKRCSG